MFQRLLCALIVPVALVAAVLGSLRGIVHDPDHRPVANATVEIKSTTSDFARTLISDAAGSFEAHAIPVGQYRATVTREGFEPAAQDVVVVSGSAPVLHFQLLIGKAASAVTVTDTAVAANPETMTPITVLTREEIGSTPGADLTNSMNMITDYVPGAWMTHDQLHVRGGHQVTWAIDGVPIPNTNIASNIGPQIDPKDIDYLEAERGGYSAAYGDRTYGVFNVVPRTGFERNNEAERCLLTFGYIPTNQRSGELRQPHRKIRLFRQFQRQPQRVRPRDARAGRVARSRLGARRDPASLFYNRDANNQLRFVTSLRGDDYQIPNDPDAAGRRQCAMRNWSGTRSLTVSPGRIHFSPDPAAHHLALLSLQSRQLRWRS